MPCNPRIPWRKPMNAERHYAKGEEFEASQAKLDNVHEYPILVDALTRLVDEVELHLPALTLLALFGSVACVEPREDSDTDILALFDLRGVPNTREREDELAT